MAIVTVRNLKKSYGNVQALHGLDFDVNEGEIYGIIGPDGAGKTSLFRILTTLLLPNDGMATVAGLDVVKDYKQIRKQIGYMPGRFSLYPDLSVEENLTFFATIFNTTIQENYHLVEDIYKQIEPFRTRKAGKLSGGMKQKLALSCALIHAPKVLFLDEPTTGVDPVSRKEFWEMLRKLKQHGITIMVSTPYMDEAILCDRIALIQDGEFMEVDTPQNITSGYSETIWSVKSNQMHQLLNDLRQYIEVTSAFSFGETFHVTVCEGTSIDALAAFLKDKGHEGIEIVPIHASIEDCFMLLTGQKNER
ncbi:ABC transporter ATP-binding protein [Bacteroides sp.]|uniref:ABC transporter ATP-binding protein n=1 Tax=Bacteroides sp. TaxID=29523 RepID=UPI0040263257